jgi:hypothetical protein
MVCLIEAIYQSGYQSKRKYNLTKMPASKLLMISMRTVVNMKSSLTKR